MRVVVRASCRHVYQLDVQFLQQLQEPIGFREVRFHRVARVHAKPVSVGEAPSKILGHPGPQLRPIRLVRVRLVGYTVECAHAHAYHQSGRIGANSFNDLAEEPCPVLEWASIGAGACVCAEELVAKVSVAVLDVHELKAQIPSHNGCTMEIPGDLADLLIRKHWRLRVDAELAVQDRMMIRDLGGQPGLVVGSAEPARVRQLQPHQQILGGTTGFLVGIQQRLQQLAEAVPCNVSGA